MNVIFVGGLHPEHFLKEIKDMGSYVDYASYTFHTALVSGLDYWFPDMRLVSALRVDAYPKVKKIYFRPEKFSHKQNGDYRDCFVGLVNLPGIKMISNCLRIRKNLKKMLSDNDDNIVIAYSLNSRTAIAVASLSKRIKRSCYIVPDLPEFMSESNSVLKRVAKWVDRKIINWAIRRFDTFALLSAHMAERLPIADKKWKQMEGMYLPPKEKIDFAKTETKTILYTGVLGMRYGIDDLLKAFSLIKSTDYRLLVRGGGEMKEEIIRISQLDSRIQYIEPLSKEDLLRLQKSATVLVNPVRKSQEFTRYFFPSKTMEYLASGTPVVMYHLDCIPKEYDEYLNYIEEETVESLKEKIIEVCESRATDAKERAYNAIAFINEKKNAIAQTKIIYDLLMGEK